MCFICKLLSLEKEKRIRTPIPSLTTFEDSQAKTNYQKELARISKEKLRREEDAEMLRRIRPMVAELLKFTGIGVITSRSEQRPRSYFWIAVQGSNIYVQYECDSHNFHEDSNPSILVPHNPTKETEQEIALNVATAIIKEWIH